MADAADVGVRCCLPLARLLGLLHAGRIVSDCIPIKGRKRIPYLIISIVLSLLPWLLLILNAPSRSLTRNLTILRDSAMIAEAVRLEQASFAGDLQSLSWFSMAFGGICSSLLGGYALSNFQIATIFFLFSILPATQLGSCYFIKEKPIEVAHYCFGKGIDKANRNCHSVVEDDFMVKKPNGSASRRKKNQNKREIKPISYASKVVNKGDSLILKWFHSLKKATFCLSHAFRQPAILMYGIFFLPSLYGRKSCCMYVVDIQYL